MGIDYYNILKVSKTVSDDDLRRAYKKLAIRWHPDKHPSSTKPTAEIKFKQICEAYDILSDPNKRHIYDLYGVDALKFGYNTYNVSSPSAATAPPRRGGGDKATSFRYNRKDGEDIFGEYFDGRSYSPKSDNGSYMKKNCDRMDSSNNNNNNNNNNKASSVENKLGCSLEELYVGSKRTMKISRIVSHNSGKPSTVEEVLAIDIKAGWKKGTKITFPEKGNQDAGLLPGDMIFVIEEKPHPTFKRDGNDLIIHHKLSLLEALTGKTLNITTLDGRKITIHVADVVKPGHEEVVEGEGMPISKDPKKKGNLRIKFDIKFPSRLTADQKADLKRVLGSRS